MNIKVLFVILVLLAVCMILGIGIGATSGSGDGDTVDPSVLGDSIRDLLDKRLTADDISSASPENCKQQLGNGVFVISHSGACTLWITRSSSSVRNLKLELTTGNSASVEGIPRDPDRLHGSQTMDHSDRKADTQMYEMGGRIVIRCLDAGSSSDCRLNTR